MANVILTKDGQRFSFPADKAQGALAAGFAEIPAARARASGSTMSIGAPPAGEDDTSTVILERDGQRFSFPADRAAAARAQGFSDPAPDIVDTVKRGAQAVADVVTQSGRQTAETETLPDFNLMPEMRQALISNTAPVVGSLAAPIAVGVESLARNVDLDAPGFGLPAAARNVFANAKTSLGTTMASADEQVRAILANNPDVKARKDEKGNTILTSAQDGKDYVVPPGVTVFDAPRAAQTLASTVPAATAGPALVAGRTLGPVASRALAGGIGAALTEGAQAVGGGDFDAVNVPIAGVANAAGPALSAAKNAVTTAVRESGEKALAAAQADAAKRAAAAAAKAPTSFNDVVTPLQAVADRVAQLSPKQRWVLKQTPIVGRALDGIDELVKILKEEGEEGAKKLPKEAREVIDDILRDPNVVGVAEDIGERGAVSSGLELVERTGRRAAAAADDAVAAVDQTITPTPTARGRSGPRVAEAPTLDTTSAGRRTPPTPQPAPLPIDEGTATSQVPRLPPPTEGLEPTEVISREVAPAARRRLSRIGDDEVGVILRKAAIENGTMDAAELASLTGLSSSQVTRVLPRLTKSAMFRAEVAAAKPAPAAAPTPAPAPQTPTPAPSSALTDTDRAAMRKAAEKAEGMLAVDPGGRQAAQVAATKEQSKWKAMYEALAPEKRDGFIAELLERWPPERVRTRLGITKKRWRQMSVARAGAKR